MKKRNSYITITTEANPNHKLILALKDKGVIGAEIIYASMWATDAGWTMVTSSIGAMWLGYTLKNALITINDLELHKSS